MLQIFFPMLIVLVGVFSLQIYLPDLVIWQGAIISGLIAGVAYGAQRLMWKDGT